jgi:hypothetical protein
LADFVADVAALPPETFAAQHGRAFLLRYGGAETLRPAESKRATAMYEPPGGASASPQMGFLVFPLSLNKSSSSLGFLSVGRTDNNDVVINDISVSQFHAVVRFDGSGAARLSDAGSTSGTFVNDQAAPHHTAGEGLPLRLGDRVRLGSVELTYLPAAQFRDLVRRLAG